MAALQRLTKAHASIAEDWTLGIALPTQSTEAGYNFFDTWARTNSLVPVIFGTAGTLTHLQRELGKMLESIGITAESISKALDDAGVPRIPTAAPQPKDPLTMLNAHEQQLWEMLFCRHVDNFHSYLTSILSEAFLARPEMLSSDEKVDVKLVVQQKNMSDVVRLLAERKVNELAYKSFDDMCEYLEGRGLPVGQPDDRAAISEATQVRNIVVHNRCVMNERFVKAVPGTPADAAGRFKWLGVRDVEPLAFSFGNLVVSLDAAAISKFKLGAFPLQIDPWKHPLADEPPPVSDDGA